MSIHKYKKYVKRILCLNENLLDLNAKKYCFKMQKAFRLYIDKSIAFNHTKKKCVLTQQCFALKSNIFLRLPQYFCNYFF